MSFKLFRDGARQTCFRHGMLGLIYVILLICNLLTTLGMPKFLITLSAGEELILYAKRSELRTLVQLVCACLITEWVDDCLLRSSQAAASLYLTAINMSGLYLVSSMLNLDKVHRD